MWEVIKTRLPNGCSLRIIIYFSIILLRELNFIIIVLLSYLFSYICDVFIRYSVHKTADTINDQMIRHGNNSVRHNAPWYVHRGTSLRRFSHFIVHIVLISPVCYFFFFVSIRVNKIHGHMWTCVYVCMCVYLCLRMCVCVCVRVATLVYTCEAVLIRRTAVRSFP